MMKFIFYPIILILLYLLSSCEFEHKQNGYPKHVHFPAEGGKIIVSGYEFVYGTFIEKNGDCVAYGNLDENDSINTSYEWLTVKNKFHSPSLEIIASPSDSKKQRKLKIIANFGTEYAEINVSQNGI